MDSETFAAESPAEQACIKNCQDKVYQSFELYMGITTRKAADAKPFIDKSAIIGMEIEHSNDTSGDVSINLQKITPNKGLDQFREGNMHENKEIRMRAFQ